jgi:ribosomal protein S18 acetylase RimI-like enzyme
MNIRPATLSDAAAIASTHIRSWQAAYAHILPAEYLGSLSVEKRAASWERTMLSGGSRILVATTEEKVTGFVCFGPCRDPEAPAGRAEIWALYASPECWSRGVGRQLLDHALSLLALDGCPGTSLWVLSANVRAMRFYGHMGFKALPGTEKRFPLGGVEVEELLMNKETPETTMSRTGASHSQRI